MAARLKRLMLPHLHSVKNFSHRSQRLRGKSLGGWGTEAESWTWCHPVPRMEKADVAVAGLCPAAS